MAQKRFGRCLALVATLVLVALTAPRSGADASLISPAGPVVIRLYVHDRDHLNAVAGELDIWEVHRQDGYVVAAVTPQQYQWLQGLGYRLEIDAEKTALLGTRAPLDPRYHYFDDFYTNANGRYIVAFLQETNAAYPELTELIDIGDAWLASQPGEHQRDIWVLRITNEDAAYGAIEDKPPFFLFATIHAREVAVPELAIRYIKYLTTGYDGLGGYGLDADVTWLVNHNVVYVLVMQNPDGHWVNEQNTGSGAYGYGWRKNMDSDDGCTNPSSWGVDLNRNHSFLWGCCGGSSADPCAETYRGPGAASEPETQAFQNYFATVIQDQNGPNGDNEIPPAAPDTTTGIFISLHSYSDLVLWPWGFQGYGTAPNDNQMTTIGRKFAYFTGYDPIGTIWYDVDGATDDWAYGKFGVPSFTFEVGPDTSSSNCGGFFPAYECLDGVPGWPQNFWAETRPAFLYAHKIARTPYITAYGPDAGDVTVTPALALPGQPVDLTATITDHRYGGDPLLPITAAEYFVDAPGADGSGTAMAASDGSWGGVSEGVQATLDTTALPLGKHYLLVHGRNSDGKWGPFTAVFLTIAAEPAAPTAGFTAEPDSLCQNESVSFTNTTLGSLPITYTWDFDDGTTSTELNPRHVYTQAGTFTPVLTASNPYGQDVATGTVTVWPIPEASFTYSPGQPRPGEWIQFTDTSSGEPTMWDWHLGDGSVSGVPNPAHPYATAGTYTVTLRVKNLCGWSPVYSQTITVAEPLPPTQRYYLPLIVKNL